jgi:DNA processing protein
MSNLERTVRNIREAINFTTLLLGTRRSESQLEPLFEKIGEVVPLADPLPLHPNTYAEASGIDPGELLETHSYVKTRFLRLDDGDIVMKRGDAVYPEAITSMPDSPRFLYARGDMRLLEQKSATIIGTRTPSDQGTRMTKDVVQALGSHQVVIVAGLAMGIEGIAHITALAMDVPTIAVLGTSLIDTYPPGHRQLQHIIGEKGLLLTRYSPAIQLQKWHFLLRSRLMSSLSTGSILIEDRDGGSAVKQADYAITQHKRVVVFQQSMDNRSLLWPRRLSLQPGVMVVKRPELIHARLYSKPKESTVEVSSGPEQLPLFDFS